MKIQFLQVQKNLAEKQQKNLAEKIALIEELNKKIIDKTKHKLIIMLH